MLARMQKSMKEKDQGFTLIELLVVMIIIGILAAVAIPVFLTQKKKAADTAVKSDLTNVAQQIETYSVDNNAYPAAASGNGGWALVGDMTDQNGQNLNIKVSPNDRIVYKPAGDGYCLAGSNNSKGTSDADGVDSGGNNEYFWYNSTTGGLSAPNGQPASASLQGDSVCAGV